MFNRRVKEVIPTIPVNSIDSLMSQSKNAISIFYKTKERLEKINEKITSEIVDRNAEIETLQLQIKTLDHAKTNNARIANNIDKILNE